MRDDELACAALGRSLFTMKIVIFAFGCGAAGLAGGLYAYYFQYISPEQFNVAQSATILTMVVLGGIGTTWGPLVGAFVLVALPQAITFLQLPSSLVGPLQGIIFTVLVIMFLFVRPHGLVGRREAAGWRIDDGEILRLEERSASSSAALSSPTISPDARARARSSV